MSKKSVVSEAQEIQLAIELIQLGARLQLLESEVSLSRERLIKLYKELKGVSPPKGMLPFSTDWFLTWQPNIHSSLYINIYKFLVEYAGATGIQAVMKAYQLYLEQMPPASFRIWALLMPSIRSAMSAEIPRRKIAVTLSARIICWASIR